MEETGRIERRPDGSLDMDHYRGIAHQLRSATARRWLQEIMDILRWRRVNAPTAPAGDGQP